MNLAAVPASDRLTALTDELRLFMSTLQKPKFDDTAWRQECVRFCESLAMRARELQGVLVSTHRALWVALEKLANYLQAILAELRALHEHSAMDRIRQLSHAVSAAYDDLHSFS